MTLGIAGHFRLLWVREGLSTKPARISHFLAHRGYPIPNLLLFFPLHNRCSGLLHLGWGGVEDMEEQGGRYKCKYGDGWGMQ